MTQANSKATETSLKKVAIQIDFTSASGYRSTVVFKGGGTARAEPVTALNEAIDELMRIARSSAVAAAA